MNNKKADIFPHDLVVKYVEIEKIKWTSPLAKHGYVEIEEDLTDDGRWHGPLRPFGKVAFWRVGKKGLDGVVVRHVKFLGDDGKTAHGTGVYPIGEAWNYVKDLGFRKIEMKEKVKISNKEYASVRLNSMDFYDFLKGN